MKHMPLPPQDTRPDEVFLEETLVVDYGNRGIRALAALLVAEQPEKTARQCFLWVRDQISHSMDACREELPYRASDVLTLGTGLCFAKSHLLVALLRANGIASGFCYQRLMMDSSKPSYCSHGFVGVWLEGWGWYRCDPRGNKPGIACEFIPGQENLAYTASLAGEIDYPQIWASPWPELIIAMESLQNMENYRRNPIDACPPSADSTACVPAFAGLPLSQGA